MESQKTTNWILVVIATLLILLCVQNMLPRKVTIYHKGSEVGSGARSNRQNALPVQVIN